MTTHVLKQTAEEHVISREQLGATILRWGLGIILLAHSVYLKLVVFTLPGTEAFFESLGLPGFIAYVVFAAEALAGFALLLGVKVRLASLLLIPVLAGATWAHWQSGWLFTNSGGGWEYPLFLTLAAAVQALIGEGAWALESKVNSVTLTRGKLS
ncbi:DoxX family protein [Motilimonas eburnea]|uniref:DoxX family protein n=1 Tax=Motilimonas eburnea TaxID=1737488 RepID=UPI001E2FBF56|nr:DoxX family protein [Motilimonas eburnea]MCE2573265.1 DoxX family protein [Motilimonas eburnea]